MKGRMILLDHIGAVEAAALMIDGQLDDLLVDGNTVRQADAWNYVRLIVPVEETREN